MNNEYYVYACVVDNQIKYIGMGKGDRYKHCMSGTSSCPELNRDFFSGKEMSVEIIKHSMSRTEAAYAEAECISNLPFEQLYNKQRGKRKDLKGVDKMVDCFCKLAKQHTDNYVSIKQAKRWIDNACFHSDYPIKIYGYDHLESWQGLPHKWLLCLD